MSSNLIEDAIHRLTMAAIRSGAGRKAELAVEDIARHIYTGRASLDYEKALCRLDDAGAQELVGRILKVWGCAAKVVSVSESYLLRGRKAK